MVLMIFIFPLTQATAIFQITSPPSFSSTLGEPGETIGVTFTIKNIGTTSGDYYVEAGIAPKGWNGYSFYPDFLYSIFKEGKCCSGNEFYDGGTVTLAAGDSRTITLNPRVPSEGSKDHCNKQGDAWIGAGSNYWIGFNACTNCFDDPGHSCIETFDNNMRTFTVSCSPPSNQIGKCVGSKLYKWNSETCAYGSETCPSGKTCKVSGNDASCEINGCTPNCNGVGCNGENGCGGTCTDACGNISGKDKATSLTQEVYDEATTELIASSMCRLPSQCSKNEIYDMKDGLTSANYTVTCKTSSSIKEINQNAILEKLRLDYNKMPWWQQLLNSYDVSNPDIYKEICQDPGLRNFIIKTFFWINSDDPCQDILSSIPSGTCRATEKNNGFDYCKYTQWASLGIIDKNNKCNDGLYTILIGLGILGFFYAVVNSKK